MPLISTLRKLRHGPLKGLSPMWLALGRIYRRLMRYAPDSFGVKQMIGPYGPFKLAPEFAFSNMAHWGGAHNKGFESCVNACRGQKVVFDIGAHVGLVAMPSSGMLAEGGCLYAFEPSRANAAFLRQHLSLNGLGNVKVVENIVGGEDAKDVTFFESCGHHGQNSIVLKNAEVLKGESGAYMETSHPQITLDSFCEKENVWPGLIKIDVEGAEIGVLHGARKVLEKAQPVIYLSVHPKEISLTGKTVEDLRQVISDMNYTISTVDGHPVEEFALDEYVMTPNAEKYKKDQVVG